MASLKKLKAILNANKFFASYAPAVKNMKNKLRGKSATGKKVFFTIEDKVLISAGIDKMYNELKKEINR